MKYTQLVNTIASFFDDRASSYNRFVLFDEIVWELILCCNMNPLKTIKTKFETAIQTAMRNKSEDKSILFGRGYYFVPHDTSCASFS